VPIVRCHHENWDGSGYPAGVSGTDIPIGARILSVVDCFDALTSDRPYRRAMTSEAAIAILRDRRGKMYDPDVVDAFIRIHAEVRIAEHDEPGRVEVLQQINRSLQGQPAPEPPGASPQPGVGAAGEVLAFVSLARLSEGNGGTADVLALSTNLIRNIAPGASGAWFLTSENGEHLTVAESFGPSAAALRTLSMGIGDKLTGWVASNRQAIVNSDAALDLGPRAAESTPPLASCLSVPLIAGQTLVAVLTLYAPGREAFSEDLGRLVQMVAPHVAAALHAARERTRSAQPQAAAPSRDFRLVASMRRS
jgi:GAF domain-containing protein